MAVLGDAGKERVELEKHGIGWVGRTLRSLYPSRVSKWFRGGQAVTKKDPNSTVPRCKLHTTQIHYENAANKGYIFTL